MTERIHCPKSPCASCPYRKDVQSGLWAAEEYDKLPVFDKDYLDDGTPVLQQFLCHQTNVVGHKLMCRGWVATHREGIAVRLAMIEGTLDPDEVYQDCPVPLFASGAEACEHGLREIEKPSLRAKKKVAALLKRGEFVRG